MGGSGVFEAIWASVLTISSLFVGVTRPGF